MLTILLSVAVADNARLPWSCGANKGCVCQHSGSFDVTSYTEKQCNTLDSLDGCIYCSKDSACNGTKTPEGLHCWPHVKECTMCASPTTFAINNLLAPDYTLYVRHRCTATSLCADEINIPIDFVPNMTINGGTGTDLTIDGMGHTLVGPCPMFVFNTISRLTIKDLNINCNATTSPETAPGILVTNVNKLVIKIDNVVVTGVAKSAITVLGGQFGLTVPKTSSDLSGSSFSGVRLQNSYSRLFMDVTLAMYYGKVDVGGMAPYSRFMIQPAVDPETEVASPFINTTSNQPPTNLIVNNFTEWTRMFGTDYEILMFDSHGTLGFSLIEGGEMEKKRIRITVAVIIGGILIIVLRFWGNVTYLYRLAKSTK
jgi:hypothetical protein